MNKSLLLFSLAFVVSSVNAAAASRFAVNIPPDTKKDRFNPVEMEKKRLEEEKRVFNRVSEISNLLLSNDANVASAGLKELKSVTIKNHFYKSHEGKIALIEVLDGCQFDGIRGRVIKCLKDHLESVITRRMDLDAFEKFEPDFEDSSNYCLTWIKMRLKIHEAFHYLITTYPFKNQHTASVKDLMAKLSNFIDRYVDFALVYMCSKGERYKFLEARWTEFKPVLEAVAKLRTEDKTTKAGAYRIPSSIGLKAIDFSSDEEDENVERDDDQSISGSEEGDIDDELTTSFSKQDIGTPNADSLGKIDYSIVNVNDASMMYPLTFELMIKLDYEKVLKITKMILSESKEVAYKGRSMIYDEKLNSDLFYINIHNRNGPIMIPFFEILTECKREEISEAAYNRFTEFQKHRLEEFYERTGLKTIAPDLKKDSNEILWHKMVIFFSSQMHDLLVSNREMEEWSKPLKNQILEWSDTIEFLLFNQEMLCETEDKRHFIRIWEVKSFIEDERKVIHNGTDLRPFFEQINDIVYENNETVDELNEKKKLRDEFFEELQKRPKLAIKAYNFVASRGIKPNTATFYRHISMKIQKHVKAKAKKEERKNSGQNQGNTENDSANSHDDTQTPMNYENYGSSTGIDESFGSEIEKKIADSDVKTGDTNHEIIEHDEKSGINTVDNTEDDITTGEQDDEKADSDVDAENEKNADNLSVGTVENNHESQEPEYNNVNDASFEAKPDEDDDDHEESVQNDINNPVNQNQEITDTVAGYEENEEDRDDDSIEVSTEHENDRTNISDDESEPENDIEDNQDRFVNESSDLEKNIVENPDVFDISGLFNFLPVNSSDGNTATSTQDEGILDDIVNDTQTTTTTTTTDGNSITNPVNTTLASTGPVDHIINTEANTDDDITNVNATRDEHSIIDPILDPENTNEPTDSDIEDTTNIIPTGINTQSSNTDLAAELIGTPEGNNDSVDRTDHNSISTENAANDDIDPVNGNIITPDGNNSTIGAITNTESDSHYIGTNGNDPAGNITPNTEEDADDDDNDSIESCSTEESSSSSLSREEEVEEIISSSTNNTDSINNISAVDNNSSTEPRTDKIYGGNTGTGGSNWSNTGKDIEESSSDEESSEYSDEESEEEESSDSDTETKPGKPDTKTNDKTIDKNTDKITDKNNDKNTDKTNVKITDKNNDKITDNINDKITDKIMDNPSIIFICYRRDVLDDLLALDNID